MHFCTWASWKMQNPHPSDRYFCSNAKRRNSYPGIGREEVKPYERANSSAENAMTARTNSRRETCMDMLYCKEYQSLNHEMLDYKLLTCKGWKLPYACCGGMPMD